MTAETFSPIAGLIVLPDLASRMVGRNCCVEIDNPDDALLSVLIMKSVL
jgi:hypothetical protein